MIERAPKQIWLSKAYGQCPLSTQSRHYEEQRSTRRQHLAQFEAGEPRREMAFEGAALLTGVGDRAPDVDPVGAALFDVDDIDRAILAGALGALLNCLRLQMRILLAHRRPDFRRELSREHCWLD